MVMEHPCILKRHERRVKILIDAFLPCLMLGSPELDGESVDGLSFRDLCKKPGGDGEVYATKFVRPGGVVDERVLSGVRGR